MALCPPAVTMFGYVRICLRVLSISKIPRRGGPPCPPEHGGTAVMDIAGKRMSMKKSVQVCPPRAGTEAPSTIGYFYNRILETT